MCIDPVKVISLGVGTRVGVYLEDKVSVGKKGTARRASYFSLEGVIFVLMNFFVPSKATEMYESDPI